MVDGGRLDFCVVKLEKDDGNDDNGWRRQLAEWSLLVLEGKVRVQFRETGKSSSLYTV